MLFVANYTESLKFLTAVLTFFQGRSVFTPQSSPHFSPSFERLVLELWPVPAGPYTPALRCYEAGPHRVQVDVSGPGSGHYELRSEATTFGFYADDYLAATGAWGLLVLTDQVLAAPPGTPYTLRFAARPAYWQYQVREPLPPAPAMFTIAGDTTGLDFEAVPPAAGSSACFRARKAVRLAQHYTLPPLHLAVYHPDAENKKKLRIILRQLPYGQITGLKEVNIKNERCYVVKIFI